jgi:hypothetical protein
MIPMLTPPSQHPHPHPHFPTSSSHPHVPASASHIGNPTRIPPRPSLKFRPRPGPVGRTAGRAPPPSLLPPPACAAFLIGCSKSPSTPEAGGFCRARQRRVDVQNWEEGGQGAGLPPGRSGARNRPGRRGDARVRAGVSFLLSRRAAERPTPRPPPRRAGRPAPAPPPPR